MGIMNYMLMAAETTGASFIDSIDFSGITDIANSVAGKAAVPMVAVLGIVIAVKLVKKFGNKIA